LKKQSQFTNEQISVNSYKKGDYGKNPLCRARKNKANLSLREQSQFIRSEFCVPRIARTELKKQSQFRCS
jgi:hypothetical protein